VTGSARPRIVVTAAIIERDGRFLVTRRLRGTHLEGLWEFPGGKCDAAEALGDCLARELREELGVEADVHERVHSTAHDYPDRCVELHFFRCDLRGTPAPQLGQEMRWVEKRALGSLAFPPADAELIDRLIRS
jgi:8-oxo-dGTP diphosphatase